MEETKKPPGSPISGRQEFLSFIRILIKVTGEKIGPNGSIAEKEDNQKDSLCEFTPFLFPLCDELCSFLFLHLLQRNLSKLAEF